MTQYGVTADGFVVKGIDVLLSEAFDRARQAFGSQVDLTPTSPLRKLLEAAAMEDATLWKRFEDGYYASFISTADGDALDLLAEDLGIDRRESFANGTVTFTLSGGVPGRTYAIPDATVVVSSSVPGLAFSTQGLATLTATGTTTDVPVVALVRGAVGNVPAGDLVAIDPAQLAVDFADLGPATITLTNAQPMTGGEQLEDSDAFRGRLLGTSRTVWTLEAAQQTVLDLDGVVDVIISDPLGGVDVSQSYFDLFDFGQRLFSAERRIGEAYKFDVIVAHEFRWPWRTAGVVPGIYDRAVAALDRVRPPGIHPNVIEADHIDIGVRARVVVEPGYDPAALLARIVGRISATAAALRLGSDVLSSQVMRAFTDEPGVIDVQGLHLRRGPAAFGRVTLGGVPYQSYAVEAPVGGNLAMGPTELAVFEPSSELNDILVVNP